ncbi:hypothetical protein [Thalassobaculum salexigens]|uniref:hypothetical protein n=1 Tax=Thalassobaculum salexigens TaxID=455360 RepID=UPI00041B45D8|nr:hypothetical protein [Thalassobaculum salexigens]
MFQTILARLSVAALLLGLLGGCNPYVWGGGALALGPNLATGRNGFYHLNKVMGKRCSDSTYFDRPVHCVNEID